MSTENDGTEVFEESDADESPYTDESVARLESRKTIHGQMARYLETGKNSFTDHRHLKVGETAIRFKGQQEDLYSKPKGIP